MPRTSILRRLPGAVSVILFLWPIGAHANTGVPLFAAFITYSWLLLIPIIGIEAYVLRYRLEISIGRASAVAGLANIVSTILGTVALVVIEFPLAFVNKDFLPASQLDIAVLVALIPCFYLSVWIESLIGAPYLERFSREQVWDIFFLANKFTYAMLAIVAIVHFIKMMIFQAGVPWKQSEAGGALRQPLAFSSRSYKTWNEISASGRKLSFRLSGCAIFSE